MLIPKPDKALTKPNHIVQSPSYTDYKILMMILANRLNAVLGEYIRQDQTGFLKNSAIGDNIRRRINIIDYMHMTKEPTILLFADAEKDFDQFDYQKNRR